MISEGYKSAYQQGYSDAMRDFREKSKTDILDKIKAIVGEWVVGAETDYFTYKCMRKIVDVIMESENKK